MQKRVAVVTGASRGVGKGVALELCQAGFMVYITGRSAADMSYIQDKGTAIVCDHSDDQQVERAFAQIGQEQNRIDVLVNNVWGGYENIVENGEFTWSRPFWQQPLWRWDAMFQAGVRAAYVASRLVAPFMILKRSGLIVDISFWSAQKHIGNVAYGVAKAATDKLTSDMAIELKEHNIAAISLYPGLVRTEKIMEAAQWLDLSNSESPEFTGRAVVALANDEERMRKSGQVLVVAALAHEYGFIDIDGKSPRPLSLAEV
jgi:NAD(P)-dependent dehydrogenase (short-subunit alcohol dehydrogenase family)